MKIIKEHKGNMGTVYLISINKEIIKEVNLQLITKKRNSNDYFLMLNSIGEINQTVFYFINYVCKYDTSNSKVQSLQALKLLYSFSEIIYKDISLFTNKDFNDFSRFVLGQSITGTQEEWHFRTPRSINTHNVYMATIRKYFRHLNIENISIFDSLVVDISKSAYGKLAHTKNRTEIKYQSNLTKKKNNKVPKFISVEEFKKIKVELINNDKLLSIRNEVIIDLMYLKGLRLGEVLGLTLEDIKNHPDNENAGILTIRNRISDKSYQCAKNSIHPKSKNDYSTTIYKDHGVDQITLPEGLKKMIYEYIDRSRDLSTISNRIISNMLEKSHADSIDSNENNYYLFLSRNGTPLTSSGWNYVLRKLFNKLSIHTDKTTRTTNLSHRFRHGYAMYLINELNLSLEEVSRYMRHRSVTSTYIYYNPTEQEIVESTIVLEKQIEQKLFEGECMY
ncbi:tyrosine-type recombinase/integrase [Virgibacillus flavescens]|uniref:tyrosine-type recombinase/integrase n=1 Tax=Virgibacillus flavescens TaxID=1611422 RepID=UPI003D353DF7